MNTQEFFAYLQRRADADTSVVATLRRSLGHEPGRFAPAFPLVEPWVTSLHAPSRRLVYLAAALWASAQRRAGGAQVPFAEAIRRVAGNTGSGSIEKRFVTLLDADEDELIWRLRSATALVNSQQIAIDWPLFLGDLLGWSHPDRYVQERWARAFWRSAASGEDVPSEVADESEDTSNKEAS